MNAQFLILLSFSILRRFFFIRFLSAIDPWKISYFLAVHTTDTKQTTHINIVFSFFFLLRCLFLAGDIIIFKCESSSREYKL